jgi:hypothetical protein
MSRIGETANRPHAEVFSGHVDPARAHQDLLRGLDGKQACPFCGAVSERTSSPCQRCGMDNTPEARKATKARIGPWYVLQARNPAAPGMRFETLLGFVRKGRVRARSVVRGPTTHQLWRFAAHVKGLSREFGLCYSCGSAIEPTANVCPQCNRLQEPPVNPDVLLEDKGEDGSLAARGPVYRELPEPGKSSAASVEAPPKPEPEPDDAEIVIPALGAFRPDDVEVKPLVEPPAPEPAPIPVPNWFQSTPASSPPPAATSRPAASRPPLDENPFSIQSAQPRRKPANNGGGDTFLSAKELAAAFKLSFDPSANMDAVELPDRMPADALPEGLPPMQSYTPSRQQQQQQQQTAAVPPMAGPAGVEVDAPRRRGSRLAAFRRVAVFMLILAGTGFGVMMWVDPAFRQKTVDWSKTSFARLRDYATAKDMKSPQGVGANTSSSPAAAPKGDDVDVPPPSPAPRDLAAAVEPKASVPVENVEKPDVAPPEVPSANAPEMPGAPAKPAAPAPPTPSPAPAAAVVAANPAAPAPAAPAPAQPAAPAPTPAEEASIPDTFEAQVALEKQLFKTGLQAEFGRPPNYEAALKAYSDIKKLPKEVWPSNLDTRINDVKRKMK